MAFALEKSRKVLRVKAKIARNNVDVVVVAGVAVVFILSSSLLFVHSLAYILSLMWKIISSHLFYGECERIKTKEFKTIRRRARNWKVISSKRASENSCNEKSIISEMRLQQQHSLYKMMMNCQTG